MAGVAAARRGRVSVTAAASARGLRKNRGLILTSCQGSYPQNWQESRSQTASFLLKSPFDSAQIRLCSLIPLVDQFVKSFEAENALRLDPVRADLEDNRPAPPALPDLPTHLGLSSPIDEPPRQQPP